MKPKIVSKVNLFQAGLLFIVGVLLFALIGVILILITVQKMGSFHPELKIAFGIIFCFAFSFLFLFHLITKFPKITITEGGIEFKTVLKTQFYLWSDIQSIVLTGKQSGNLMFMGMPLEATTINLSDTSSKIIWAHYIGNIAEVRKGFQLHAQSLLSNEQIEKDLLGNREYDINEFTSSSSLGYPEVYKGNALLSFNGFIIIGWLVFVLIMCSKYQRDYTPLFILTALVCGFMFYQLNYFIIVENQLIVKNHFWRGFEKIYNLDNLYEVVIEVPYRRSTSLRVIDVDFNSRIYAADSLSNKTWRALMAEFVRRKIPVRNEAGI